MSLSYVPLEGNLAHLRVDGVRGWQTEDDRDEEDPEASYNPDRPEGKISERTCNTNLLHSTHLDSLPRENGPFTKG